LNFFEYSIGGNLTYAQGEEVIMTRDGSYEKANLTFQFIGNITQAGKPVSYGSVIYNINPTGRIVFLDI
jgi:hypothetical protein